ncbi:hypothetical protein PAXRUDRAFT_16078 [Paxillus rubicundulus Ve08.2h10]|uniref:Unplaced genomic scaffold scaffold_1331, whole genome shotgun sequence n=1 Tax=Paxillus rubicundulus Ve08.2h10 TaxID=930991 RepID=A0A0D0CAI9_9AGAM|nr:hypothetical protein PAXRUDRAFT_16078 [Paxillus rubicundulus Ve08.2h10]
MSYLMTLMGQNQNTVYVHENASLQECCQILEIQVLKLTTEHDCINTLFQQLRSTLGSQTLNSTNNYHMDPLLVTTSSDLIQPTYPILRCNFGATLTTRLGSNLPNMT